MIIFLCFAANEIKGICVDVVDEIKITFIFLSLNAIFGFLIYVDLSFFAALIESFLLISNTYLRLAELLFLFVGVPTQIKITSEFETAFLKSVVKINLFAL